MDTFFTQKYCDRCHGSLGNGRIMSMFSTECICMDCKNEEIKDKEYKFAVKTEREEVKKGNYNYKGIRG